MKFKKLFTFTLALTFTISSLIVGATTYYSWRYREHATDCTSLTDGRPRDLCYEEDDDKLYKCEAADGLCNTAGEWKVVDNQTTNEVTTSTVNFDNNLSGTDSDVQTALETLDDISLYTSSDFDTDFAGKDTGDLSEGTNLYFTTGRIDSYLSGGTGIGYSSGTISFNGSLTDLSDVNTAGVTDGNVLRADGTDWESTTLAISDLTFTAGTGLTLSTNTLSNDLGTDISYDEIAASTLVTESDSIASNDNDTTVPTSAAVKDYADTNDTDTTYSASGTLLDLTSTTFSVNEGTLTDGQYCTYVTGTGLVCNSDLSEILAFNDLSDMPNGNITVGNITVGDGNTIGTSSYGWLFDESNGDISTTAKVGIGTTSPSKLLTIQAASGNNADIRLIADAGEDSQDDWRITADGAGLKFQDTYGRYPLFLGYNAGVEVRVGTGAGYDFQVENTDGDRLFTVQGETGNTKIPKDNAKLYFGADDKASIYDDGSNFVFDSQETGTGDFYFKNGNVGIGTASPSQKLHIAAASPGIRLEETDQTPNQEWRFILGGGNLILQDVTNDEFVFMFEPKSKNALKFYEDGSIRFSNGEMWLNSTGDLEMSWDNNKIYFGTGDDASITYDGTDMQINPAEVGSGSLEIGDGTNYTEIKSDGEINLHGTARVKKEFDISITKLSPGGSGATTAQIGNYAGESFDINDDVVGSFEVPHDCDTSENLEFRVYWAIDEAYATNSGEVQWELDWSATSADETEALDSPTHTGTIDFGDQDIPATAKYLTRTSAGVLSSASLSDDDLVGFTVKRIALDGGSNPTADPIAFRVEVEYTSNKLGEAL